MHVDAMCRSLTGKQFMGLVAFHKMSPTRGRRSDILAAQIAKAIFDANQRLIDVLLAVNAVPQYKRPKLQEVDLEKFVLEWGAVVKKAERKTKQTWQEQQRIMALWAAAYSQVKAEEGT